MTLDDLSPRIKQLKERREQLEAQKWELDWQLKEWRVELADIETVTRYVQDLRNLLSQSAIAERKSFIKSFVKEIVMTNDTAILKYTIPLPKAGVLEEHLGVLHIAHHGGAEGSRTPDLLRAREALSQLSYSPIRQFIILPIGQH